MLIAIPDVLTPDKVRLARHKLDTAPWVDGKVTAGPQSARTKDNCSWPRAIRCPASWAT